MPWAAIIPAVGALAGGLISANAAGNAADQSAAASGRAADLQMQMYQQTRADTAPEREARNLALDALLSMTGLPGISAYKDRPAAGAATRSGAGGGLRSLPRLGGSPITGGRNSGLYDAALSDLVNLSGTFNGGGRNTNWDMTAPRANRLPLTPRMLGGPIRQGQRYSLSELGHPEGIYNNSGELQNITTSPQTMTAQEDGYVQPLGGPQERGFDFMDILNPIQVGSEPGTIGGGINGILGGLGGGGGGSPTASPTTFDPGVLTPINSGGAVGGLPIPGSSVTENPGGQPGRYNFMADPGYGFRFDEGLRAVSRSHAAKGMGLSGGILKALTRYGQGQGSQEYGNVYNRISNIAGLSGAGQGITANAGMAAAGNQGNFLSNMGDAHAAGTLGRGSAYGDTLAQLGRIYGQYSNSNNPTMYGYSSGGSITP